MRKPKESTDMMVVETPPDQWMKKGGTNND
jgi:hypothetical protein